ncbi:hypothetical protein PROFUN_01799 [Planoprotostelium fungivorum]|uniref:TBC1 domain family member 13 n=1 Tax=Planoprotostelium fungivorum TaxID=1890364 RepID=A0A2P6NYR1_9EUKA|nr:hypothetical protein PROFUN_01799 [Planoprotostelium fungivorum]
MFSRHSTTILHSHNRLRDSTEAHRMADTTDVPSNTSDPLSQGSKPLGEEFIEIDDKVLDSLNISPRLLEEKEKRQAIWFRERLGLFQSAIEERVDFKKVKQLAFDGIPDHPGLRSVYWKILLGYLPTDKSAWSSFLVRNRKLYDDWVVELVVDPHEKQKKDDHPLNTSSDSSWNAFFKDNELLDEVDKDVKRTLPHLHFFNHDKNAGSTEHYEALKRILFIYAKLNPGIRYVQGMNEILGPIYYVYAMDATPMFQGHAEADAFFSFTSLMGEIRDNFCKSLDKSETGIAGNIMRLNNLLKDIDHELWEDFEEKKLNPQFYSFRWLTLLLSQEFDLPDVLRLWDSLFSDPRRFDFLLDVCSAMIVQVREQLLSGTFADNLKLLQNYHVADDNAGMQGILQRAKEIRDGLYVAPLPRPKADLRRFIGSPALSRPAERLYNSPTPSPYKDLLPPMALIKTPNVTRSVESSPVVTPHKEEERVNTITGGFLKPPRPFDASSSDEDEEPHSTISHPLAFR